MNQFDLFDTQPLNQSGLQTDRFHYQTEHNQLIVTDLTNKKEHRYLMQGVIHKTLKANVIERLKKALSDRPTLPRVFFKSFMTMDEMQHELNTWENL